MDSLNSLKQFSCKLYMKISAHLVNNINNCTYRGRYMGATLVFHSRAGSSTILNRARAAARATLPQPYCTPRRSKLGDAAVFLISHRHAHSNQKSYQKICFAFSGIAELRKSYFRCKNIAPFRAVRL